MTGSYAVVTPARNEAEHLPLVGACLAGQSVRPRAWIIVDNGSEDGTAVEAHALAQAYDWVRVASLPGGTSPVRGGPVVRSFNTGLAALRENLHDVIVKLDADVTMEPTYFERLLAVFALEPQLGIASGICHEQVDGEWRPLYGTRRHVWGAARAYRRECLLAVLPLEERQGWDEIDALRAQLQGWTTRTIFDLPFRHHRPEGARDGQARRWADQGETARFMGYRPSYLVLRTLYQATREPRALAMGWGYVRAALRGMPQLEDAAVRAHLREQQRLRSLGTRAREALGRNADTEGSSSSA
jgi:glycosyltransferase involved in cell wall biosynthesis